MAEDWGQSEAYIRDMLLEEQVWAAMEQETREAFLTEYEAAHPGFLDEFDPDAWFQAAYPYYLPPEQAFMNDYGLVTREEFENYMAQDYINHLMYMEDLQSDIDGWLAEDPTLLDGFDVNEYFAQEYAFYDSREEFMADCTLVDHGGVRDLSHLGVPGCLRRPGGVRPLDRRQQRGSGGRPRGAGGHGQRDLSDL